jgi:BASS family bile acid:Na+ symporter
MTDWLEPLLKMSVVLFMVGNLLAMGLVLKIQEALAGLRNPRFVILSVLTGFVLCPGLAWLLTQIIPLAPPYAAGMILLGMTPCAPFLPIMVERARGDMGYTAAFMLLASLATVFFMPLAVPMMVEGLTANAWTIAKPLLLVILFPLAIGLAIQKTSPGFAAKLHPPIKKTTGLITIVMLILCVMVYGKGFLNALGAYAIGTQILFYILATGVTFGMCVGLPEEQKSVLALGICTRNLGAAFAPLFSVAAVDERAIIMVALGVPLQTIAAVLTAHWLGRRSSGSIAAKPESPSEGDVNCPP